jgi:hypothetical protein
VVCGFLWCAAKKDPQLDAQFKQAYKLNGKWPDKETQAIVSVHTSGAWHGQCRRLTGCTLHLAGILGLADGKNGSRGHASYVQRSKEGPKLIRPASSAARSISPCNSMHTRLLTAAVLPCVDPVHCLGDCNVCAVQAEA